MKWYDASGDEWKYVQREVGESLDRMNPNFLGHVNEKICEIKRYGIKNFDDNSHTYIVYSRYESV